MDWVSEVTGEVGETVVEMRYRVPEGYLEDEVERVRMLIGQIEAAGKDQTAIDEVYDKLLVMMKERLVEVKARRTGVAMVYKRDCKAEEDCQWCRERE